MNERIRELAEQAVIMTSAEVTWHKDRISWQKLYDQKFAELIVKECADAIIKDSRLNDVRSAANGCVRTIKEHFGVEWELNDVS
jgi:metal-dependent amidase/aminoacylase/carboxypeptidase family protein